MLKGCYVCKPDQFLLSHNIINARRYDFLGGWGLFVALTTSGKARMLVVKKSHDKKLPVQGHPNYYGGIYQAPALDIEADILLLKLRKLTSLKALTARFEPQWKITLRRICDSIYYSTLGRAA